MVTREHTGTLIDSGGKLVKLGWGICECHVWLVARHFGPMGRCGWCRTEVFYLVDDNGFDRSEVEGWIRMGVFDSKLFQIEEARQMFGS